MIAMGRVYMNENIVRKVPYMVIRLFCLPNHAYHAPQLQIIGEAPHWVLDKDQVAMTCMMQNKSYSACPISYFLQKLKIID